VAWSRTANAPFPLPAHRTGRADFPHPALRLASWQGPRRLRLRLAIELSLERPDLIGCFRAHRQSPPPRLLRQHARSEGPSLHRSYSASPVLRPSPTPAWPAALATALGLVPATTGLPRLPVSPFQRAVPITPVDHNGCFCRLLPHRTRPSPIHRRVGVHKSLSRPAQALLTLRPAGLLSRPRRPLSRGFSTPGCPSMPLVSYQRNPTTLRMEPTSTGDTRPRGALWIPALAASAARPE
jgi:hypothetical protein